MKTFWVILTDDNPNNPANVRAFFETQAAAIAYRDTNFAGSAVRQAALGTFDLVYVL